MHSTRWYTSTLKIPKPASVDPPCVPTVCCILIITGKHKNRRCNGDVAVLEHNDLGFCGTNNLINIKWYKWIPVHTVVWLTATFKKVRQSNTEASTIKTHAVKLPMETNTLIFPSPGPSRLQHCKHNPQST